MMRITPWSNLRLQAGRLFCSQLRVNMASGVITTGVNALILLISYPLYLHFLGYEKYGVWLVLSTVMMFAQLGGLGLAPALMKLVAEELGKGDHKGIERYSSTALALMCVSGAIVLTIILLLKAPIIGAFRMNGENSLLVSWLLPYIGGLTIYAFLVQTLGAVLSGMGRMDFTNYIVALGAIVQAAVAAFLLSMGFAIPSLLIGSICSLLVIHAVTLKCIRRIASFHFCRIENLSVRCCLNLIRFGNSIFLGSLISMLLNPFNRLAVSRYTGVMMVPVYDIAFSGGMQVRNLIEAGLRSIVPEISRVNANNSSEATGRVYSVYRRSVRLILVLGIPLFGILAILAPTLLKAWLRSKFVPEVSMAFVIMLAGMFLSLAGVPAYYTLVGLGRVHHVLAASVVQGVLNVLLVLGMATLSVLSINGVVVCTSLSFAASTAYLLFQNRRIRRGMSFLPNQYNGLDPSEIHEGQRT